MSGRRGMPSGALLPALLLTAMQGALGSMELPTADVSSPIIASITSNLSGFVSYEMTSMSPGGTKVFNGNYQFYSTFGGVNCPLLLGGKIRLQDGNFIFNSVVFQGRDEPQASSLIEIYGNTNVTFLDCTFEGFKGYGAILVDGTNTNVTIRGSTFSNNACDFSDCGGALTVASGANIVIYTTLFQENSSPLQGGAILAESGSAVLIRQSEFVNNTVLAGGEEVDQHGGAVAIRGGGTYALLYNSTFIGNHGPDRGGALSVWGKAEAAVLACTFDSNSAASGGAISIRSADSSLNSIRTQVWIYWCHLMNNSLTSTYASGKGTAISVESSLLFVENTTVEHHFSAGKGTVSVSSTPGTQDSLLSLLNVTFVNNTAVQGGNIYASQGANVSAVLVRFHDSVGLETGGSIFATGGVTISGAAIRCENCRAGLPDLAGNGQGGCLFAQDGTTVVFSAIERIEDVADSLVQPKVESLPPVMQLYLQPVSDALNTSFTSTIRAAVGAPSVFASCEAQAGGAIKALNSSISLSDTVFTGNLATDLSGGSALYLLDSDMYMRNSVMDEATCFGAATVFVQGGTSLIVNSEFFCSDDQLKTVTTDGLTGSALFNVPEAVVVANVTFANMNYTNRYSVGSDFVSVPVVYADDLVDQRNPPLSLAAWATCWTLDVVGTTNSGFTSSGYILSPLSDLPVVSRGSFLVPVLEPLIAERVGMANTGCSDLSEEAEVVLSSKEPLLTVQYADAVSPPLPKSGYYNTALVTLGAIAVLLVVFGFVCLIFHLTKPSLILEGTSYWHNIALLKGDDHHEDLCESCTVLVKSLWDRCTEAAGNVWCRLAECFSSVGRSSNLSGAKEELKKDSHIELDITKQRTPYANAAEAETITPSVTIVPQER